MPSQNRPSPDDGLLAGKLVHLALPVRWSLIGGEGRSPAEMACTYDVHAQGARLLGTREVHVGDMMMLERGRNKAICQVVWAADAASALRGQFTVQCVDGRSPWDEELRQIQEQYQPIDLDEFDRGKLTRSFSGPQTSANRRRRPRFYVEGQAQVIDGVQRVEGELQQISEFGARIASTEILRPGTDCRLALNIFDVSLAVKAQVKYMVDNLAMGVEFHEIRRGDRPLLTYVLSKLRNNRVKEFVDGQMPVPPLASAVG
ncbi:MAG TPA: PilZ domain-containing protein [Candidatus Sulfotelmatobacter sp.]|nr:PilZ domain-containing protein [Candidatus Sulfotelmatobacter sp.]